MQWQKKLERRIHSSRGDVFMNRKTNGIIYILYAPFSTPTPHDSVIGKFTVVADLSGQPLYDT
jgi:hypothetical protein